MSMQNPKNTSIDAILSTLANNLRLTEKKSIDATAWFLGPKAENAEAFLEMITMAAQSQIDIRHDYMPNDPSIFCETTEDSDAHKDSIKIIKDQLQLLLNELRSSLPMASYRNQSHMNWDLTLPGFIGYFAAMLYNQNNVAAEASPVTTLLEVQVGKDLCEMLGFHVAKENAANTVDKIDSWGHITCDGSIANGEAMWAARNLKFLPVALAAAIAVEAELEDAKGFSVATCRGGRDYLINLDLRSLLNLPIDEVIDMVANIKKQTGVDEEIIRHAVDQYSVQALGLVNFQQRYLDTYEQATPVVLVPATAHYSWPKSAALIGLGTTAVKAVEVDLDGRMSMKALRRQLDRCLEKGQPVLQVVVVMGSTAEGAVDPLADIIRIREEYQAMGLNFVIHVDAAWGGYFRSILLGPLGSGDKAEVIDNHPLTYVNDYFVRHFEKIPLADSVTLDPHKSGFIPYPAGSLCYRNGAMRDLIAFTSPVVFHGGFDVTVGPYGIEGSKPGAAAASVYLSHKVIPLNRLGYGRILGRCLFNNKRFYAALVAMDITGNNKSVVKFNITPFQRLPVEKEDGGGDIIEQKRYIKEHIVPYSTQELIEQVFGLGTAQVQTEQQEKALKTFQEIGSDLSIVAYAFNFKIDGELNTDLTRMNEFNTQIYRALSLQPTTSGDLPENKLFITSSEFDPKYYGQPVIDDFVRRAGVEAETDTPVTFLISTTQNPWLSTTGDGTNMINQLIEILAEKVNQIAIDMDNQYSSEKCHQHH